MFTPLEEKSRVERFELTIGEDGGIALPAEVRRALGVENGGWVTLREVDGRIEITSAKRSAASSDEDAQRQPSDNNA